MFIETQTTLAEMLAQEGQLSWKRTLRILKGLIRELSSSHEEGRVIGNLHPAQIYLNKDEEPFIGALHGMEAWEPDESQRPLLYYQSPEQLRGEAPTPLSDQFSLAVIGFEMISGQMPFDAEDEEWLRHSILSEPPALLSMDVDAPPGIGSVLRRAMAKAPDERYEDVKKFGWALESLGATQPGGIVSPGTSPFSRQRMLWGGLIVGLVIAGLFALAAQKGLTFWQAATPTPMPVSAETTILPTATFTPSLTPTLPSLGSATPETQIIAVANPAAASPSPTPTPTSSPTQPPIPTLVPTSTPTPVPVAKALRNLNLRRGPATTHPVVMQATKGDIFTILGRTANGAWLQVDSPKGNAWVSAKLVEIQGSQEAITVVAHPPTPPPPPIARIRPQLISPPDGVDIAGTTTFAWQWPGPALPTNDSFALLIWKEEGMPHQPAALAGMSTSLSFDPNNAAVVRQGGPGRYYWSVVIVEQASGRVVGTEAVPRTFTLQPPPANDGGGNSGGGGNNGGNNGGGGGGNDGGGGGGGGSRPPRPSPPREPPPQ